MKNTVLWSALLPCLCLAFFGRPTIQSVSAGKERKPSPAPISGVSLAPDGKRGLTCLGDTLTLWSLPDGKELRRFEPIPGKPLVRPLGPGYDISRVVGLPAVDWNANVAVAGDGNGVLRVWDLASGKLLRTILGSKSAPNPNAAIVANAMSTDGKRVYSSALNRLTGAVDIWELGTGKHLKTVAERNQPADSYRDIIPLPGKERAILRGYDRLALWDFENDKAIWEVKGDPPTLLAANQDGERLLTFRSPMLLVRDSQGKQMRVLLVVEVGKGPETHEPSAMAFLPDGKRALTGGRKGELILWDTESGKVAAEWTGSPYNERIGVISVSGNGNYALTGSDRGVLQLWDVTTGKLTRDWTEPRTTKTLNDSTHRDRLLRRA